MASYKISYVPQTVSVFELSSISTRNGQATSAYQVKQQHLDSSALDSWLATLPGTQNAAPATVLRMVRGYGDMLKPQPASKIQPERLATCNLSFTQATFAQLRHKLRLPRYFDALVNSTSNRVLQHIQRTSSGMPQVMNLGLSFKVDVDVQDAYTLLITYDTASSTTNALFLTATSAYKGFDDLTRALTDAHGLLLLPAALPVLVSELVYQFAVTNVADFDKKLLELEATTEQMLGESSDLTELDFFKPITRTLNVVKKGLGRSERRLRALLLLVTQVEGTTEVAIQAAPTARRPDLQIQADTLAERCNNLRGDCEHLLLQVQSMKSRVDDQHTIVFNFMAQKETLINQLIATASMKDGSAMKAIAILTMCFLPGTFVATLFAMPVMHFDTSAGSHVLGRGFVTFWEVTIPLTAFVLLLWAAWMYRERLLRKASHDRSSQTSRSIYELQALSSRTRA